jgi:hypothetical protein
MMTEEQYKTDYADKLISKKSIHPLLACLCPVRVDSIKNFCKDFFFPTTVNHSGSLEKAPSSSEIDFRPGNSTQRTIKTVGCVLLDLATLPFRILAIPFRLMASKIAGKEKEHPLQKPIAGLRNVANEEFPGLKDADDVEVHVITWQTKEINNKENQIVGLADAIYVDVGSNIHLKTQPAQSEKDFYVEFAKKVQYFAIK